jgi:predicted flap endonuclease-1-like 5' DNA nuclease
MVRPVVAEWAADRAPAWTDDQVDAVTVAVRAVADAAIALVVPDVEFDDEDEQAYLLARALRAVEDRMVATAAGLRMASRSHVVRLGRGAPAAPLRSSTVEELEALEGIGPARAATLARAGALHPQLRSVADLEGLAGIGPATAAAVDASVYLDRPAMALVSPALVAFVARPSIEHALAVLDATDLEFSFGDATRRALVPPAGGLPVERFVRLVDLVAAESRKRWSPAAGVLASDIRGFVARRRKLDALEATLRPVSGEVVVNAAFAASAVAVIGAATDRVRMMMFLATATAPGDAPVGSLAVIEALEAQAAALGPGAVRVLVDRDDQDDPYHSEEINRAVVERLRASAVRVKSDLPDTLLHSKFLVADDRVVLVGSHNVTRAALNDTREVGVRLDGDVAAGFAARFDALWDALP